MAHSQFAFVSPGFLPRLIKVAPACAIMISTYEFGKAFFRKNNQERILGPLQTSNTWFSWHVLSKPNTKMTTAILHTCKVPN